MNTNEAASFEDQKEKLNTFLEIASTEKELFSTMHSKGLLHIDVQKLYHKARASYENVMLSDHEEGAGLLEIEFLLWKLHYKHIDEYRKLMRQSNADDKYKDGFKSFLSEATQYYEDLLKKFRSEASCSGQPKKCPRRVYVYHRFLVCLGDLARYRELCKERDAREWAISSRYYLEASRTCPDSGNPHNQLALLATYVDDPFLALYHCVRSLAVNEPFPDAQNNLILLLEENKSSHIESLSGETHLGLLKPWEKTRSSRSRGSSNDVWPLFVRLISFFLLKSSLEDFPNTIASFVRELEALMELSDEELKTALESYRSINTSRKGPYRTLQLVTIFVFVVDCLTESDKTESQKDLEKPEDDFTKLALAATFVCVGRITERCNRCLNGASSEQCPLLPAVLVFVEWLTRSLKRVETYATDQRVMSSMSYFISTFVDLLNRLDFSNEEVSRGETVLWEDRELKGFEFVGNLSCQNKSRTHRIFLAATEMRSRIVYDNVRKRFHNVVSKSHSGFDTDSVTTEEEEEEEELILFKPITRHNSAPVSTKERGTTSDDDESIRRASSLRSSRAQTRRQDSFSFHTVSKESWADPPRPPSLKWWVVEKTGEEQSMLCPSPVSAPSASVLPEEGDGILGAPPSGYANVSVEKTGEVQSMLCPSPVSAATPVPSAPFLPEEGDGILGAAPPTSVYANFQASRGPYNLLRGNSSILKGHPPLQGTMSSSEWLYHYRNRPSLDRVDYTWWPTTYGYPNAGNNVSRYGNGLDQWGNSMVSSPSSSPAALYMQRAMELRSEQSTLLQYLKQRELLLQQEFQFRGLNFYG